MNTTNKRVSNTWSQNVLWKWFWKRTVLTWFLVVTLTGTDWGPVPAVLKAHPLDNTECSPAGRWHSLLCRFQWSALYQLYPAWCHLPVHHLFTGHKTRAFYISLTLVVNSSLPEQLLSLLQPFVTLNMQIYFKRSATMKIKISWHVHLT